MSFTQNCTFNLILDLINGGNLLEFLQSNPPPTTAEDIWQFWNSFADVFKGLHCVHQLRLEKNLDEIRG